MDEYLKRIGAARPASPDSGSLRELQLRHLLTVPFENLSIHLGEPVVLDDGALVDKVVGRRRGGFCYELNGAFAVLLRTLGHEVTLLSARVFADGVLGPPFDHMALRVNAPDPWLVDVGFGRFAHHPLRLDLRTDQLDPGGVFRLTETEEGDLDVLRDGVPQYRLERRPRVLADFEATCWWQQTSPKSHFTRSPVCTILTEEGRLTLTDRLLVRTVGDAREERNLATDAETLAAYRDHFGIELTRPPATPPRQRERAGE
ncbi:arylamine N-acetyltransferase family protein [Streptosporangium carneum]|uniref:N-hydroxyarylamine O-acetyltransferase n=1 Tax=Streptosporangium carneum TaxID=47481 RepID=A0A9W6HWV2_9ACTN|nr:arylamine N-acetyltransferase [Streptosporangium carneum]GLK07830.1 N-hydroxyarylamine O-acetyltransferase [Streptosporangium carneum]